MIVLHPANESNFDCLGLGAITDAISCKVTRGKYGIFDLEMVYPVTGRHFQQLQMDRIITAPPNDHAQVQPFRIDTIEPSLVGGSVTVRAAHISYQLRHIPVKPFTAESTQAAMDALSAYAVTDCPFSFSTDIVDEGRRYSFSAPASAKKILMGSEESITTISGGELEFDRYHVTLHSSRGRDSGLIISRGKNLQELEQLASIQDLITGYYPFWTGRDEAGNTISNHGILVTLKEQPWSYSRILPLDLSHEFDEMPPLDDMRTYAEWKLQRSIISAVVSNSIKFFPLWQAAQYQGKVIPERIDLYDTVRVKVDLFGIDERVQIVKTVYDVLAGRYESLELGEQRSSLPRTLAKILTRMT